MPIDAHKDSNIMFLTFNNCLELCNNMIGMKNCLNPTSAKRKDYNNAILPDFVNLILLSLTALGTELLGGGPSR
ncbi:unnamed protein product [Enterobius vermicularis]|uniref:Uncharacterized protein n=1 Tax=Enterobius vermicularis TaxID=51028 RepID=A0A0N4V4Z5_ENTVE|nr:unnamed protein product [Enterobius vermicularis]